MGAMGLLSGTFADSCREGNRNRFPKEDIKVHINIHIYIYTYLAPKTMKHQRFGHQKTRLFTIKPSQM